MYLSSITISVFELHTPYQNRLVPETTGESIRILTGLLHCLPPGLYAFAYREETCVQRNNISKYEDYATIYELKYLYMPLDF